MSEHTRYRPSEWLDPRVEVRSSPLAGLGLFARSSIRAGEPVVIWGGVVFTQAEVDTGKAAPSSTVPIGERLYLGSLAGTYVRERDDLGDFMNHSCDPSCWMEDEVTLVARRDVRAGEELTADYAFWKGDDAPVVAWKCQCGSLLCRGTITGSDWRLTDLQERYAGHFSPYINERLRRMEVEP